MSLMEHVKRKAVLSGNDMPIGTKSAPLVANFIMLIEDLARMPLWVNRQTLFYWTFLRHLTR